MVKLKNLEIRYDDFVAMSDLNLTINENEFFTFLGPSGCGKTTILRSITGFVGVHSGSIEIDEVDITNKSVESRGVGIVFQSYALFPTMNVYDNIAFGLKVRKVPKEIIDKEVREIAKKIDLSEKQLFKKAHELSGGQQQRVAIARALILKPKILCLDEPLSNLDAKLRDSLRQELKRLQREFNITFIYITHDQEEALTMSDRIAVFNNGKLEQVGTPDEIFEESETEFVANFIGEINRIPYEYARDVLKIEGLKEGKDVYVRHNNVKNQDEVPGEFIEVAAKVTKVENHGIYKKYSYIADGGIKIKNIVASFTGKVAICKREKVKIYIKKSEIKQYDK